MSTFQFIHILIFFSPTTGLKIGYCRSKYVFPKDLAKRWLNKTRTVSRRTGRIQSASSDEDNNDDEDVVNIETIQTVNDKNNLMSCLRSANLKDYTNLSTNNYSSLESSSNAKIYSHDGSVMIYSQLVI